MVDIYKGILFSHKKRSMPFLATWIDLKGIKLSEIGQKEKDKNHMISLKCAT